MTTVRLYIDEQEVDLTGTEMTVHWHAYVDDDAARRALTAMRDVPGLGAEKVSAGGGSRWAERVGSGVRLVVFLPTDTRDPGAVAAAKAYVEGLFDPSTET